MAEPRRARAEVDGHGNVADDCGHCTLLPAVSGYGRAVKVGCPVHSEHPVARRVRTQAERATDNHTLRAHDSDVWETVGGWLFGCRTCLEHEVYGSRKGAMARKQVHDSRALPWWVERFNQDAK